MQAIAKGYINNIDEGREIILNSFDVKDYEPQDIDQWEEKYRESLKYL